MSNVQLSRWCALCMALVFMSSARSEQVKVLRAQGYAHGFVEVTTLDGARIANGDLVQHVSGSTVTSRLVLSFLDGSVDDETTVYSQSRMFRLIRDHHVQHGPSFPDPVDATVDAGKGLVISTDAKGRTTQARIAMPADVYNGMTTSVLMNLAAPASPTVIAVVVAEAKPRIVHLSMKSAGPVTFAMGGISRQATDFVVHVDIGGVAGVVAPLIGKQPLDYHVLILAGDTPAFIREEGPLYVGGPVWRIQQVSAMFSK